MPPELNLKRAVFVLGKIDEILAWERERVHERDLRFVDLGRYLCEVRAGQYWRLEKMKSFDDFLEKRFPDSRRKAYYLMAIHENLTRVPKQQLREIGWTKARELAKVARQEGQQFESAPWVHKAQELPKEEFIHPHMFSSSIHKKTRTQKGFRFNWQTFSGRGFCRMLGTTRGAGSAEQN